MKQFRAQLLVAANFPVNIVPALRAPISVATSTTDANVAVTPGWYMISVIGNPVVLGVNTAAASAGAPVAGQPQYPVGYWPIPVFIGIPAVPGQAATATTLHYASITSTGNLTLTPLDVVGSN